MRGIWYAGRRAVFVRNSGVGAKSAGPPVPRRVTPMVNAKKRGGSKDEDVLRVQERRRTNVHIDMWNRITSERKKRKVNE